MFVVSPSSKTLLSFYDRGFAFFSGPNNIPLFSKTARVFMKFLELQLLFPKKERKKGSKILERYTTATALPSPLGFYYFIIPSFSNEPVSWNQKPLNNRVL